MGQPSNRKALHRCFPLNLGHSQLPQQTIHSDQRRRKPVSWPPVPGKEDAPRPPPRRRARCEVPWPHVQTLPSLPAACFVGMVCCWVQPARDSGDRGVVPKRNLFLPCTGRREGSRNSIILVSYADVSRYKTGRTSN